MSFFSRNRDTSSKAPKEPGLNIPAPRVPALSRTDTCDGCVARAYVRALLATGTIIYLCRHHYLKHELELMVTAVELHDDTWLLDAEVAR